MERGFKLTLLPMFMQVLGKKAFVCLILVFLDLGSLGLCFNSSVEFSQIFFDFFDFFSLFLILVGHTCKQRLLLNI